MKTQSQTKKILAAHLNDLKQAQDARAFWTAKEKVLKLAIRDLEREDLKAQVVRSREVIK